MSRRAIEDAPDAAPGAALPGDDVAPVLSCFRRHPDLFADAITIRAVEEELLALFRQGLLNGTVHTCVGQELVGPAVSRALAAGDWVLSNHRGHGHFYARTHDLVGLVGEVMGRTCGASGGVGGSQHLSHPRYLSNGVQGGMAPIAAGLAEAAKRSGDSTIALVYIGDGTLGEGALYETLNLAGVRRLPLLLVLEHNRYAQSTHSGETFAGSLEERVRGFGVGFLRASVWEPQLLVERAAAAVAAARSGEPLVLTVDCYRLNAHSKGDDNRSRAELEHHRSIDPLNRLFALGLPDVLRLRERAAQAVRSAVEEARSSPVLERAPGAAAKRRSRVGFEAAAHGSDRRINQLVNAALAARLESCPQALVVGEDVCDRSLGCESDYGGAFKVTRGLSTAFPGRVLNFPISEAALVGFGTGLAVAGLKPIVEIMFGDFLTLTFDQVYQHAAKLRRMSAGRVSVPLLIRTPMGGKRGYGPTHSQSIEKFFLGIPDLMVVALNDAVPPERIYRAAFDSPDPVLVIENKVLYTRPVAAPRPSGLRLYLSDEPFPTVRLTLDDLEPEVTVICYGEMLATAEAAAREVFADDEVVCEVIAPSCLQPLDLGPIADSVERSGRLVVVEEGPSTAAFGGEVLARLAEEGIVVRAFRRLGNDGLVPASLAAELDCIASPGSVATAIRDCRREPASRRA